MNMCHIFTLTVDIEKTLDELEDIRKQILLAKFHENLTLQGRDDSIFKSAPKIESAALVEPF